MDNLTSLGGVVIQYLQHPTSDLEYLRGCRY